MNENEEISTSKDIYYLKIKKYNSHVKTIKKAEILSSDINDYMKVKSLVSSSRPFIENINIDKEQKLIFHMYHPKLKDFIIHSEKEWDIYKKFNIITECIINKTLKIEYALNNDLYETDIDFKKDKKEEIRRIMEYILKYMPIESYFRILHKFLRENFAIAKRLKNYFIEEILNNETSDIFKTKKNKHSNIEDNLDINKIINNKKLASEEKKQKEPRKKKENKLYSDFFIHTHNFLSILEDLGENCYLEKKERDSPSQISFSLIQKKSSILEEIKEKENSNSLSDFTSRKESSTYQHQKNKKNNLYNFDLLLSQIDTNSDYATNLINEDNLFKTIDKNEYFEGIEEIKNMLYQELHIIIDK